MNCYMRFMVRLVIRFWVSVCGLCSRCDTRGLMIYMSRFMGMVVVV